MRKVFYFHSNISRIATSQNDFIERFVLYADYVSRVTSNTSVEITLMLGGVRSSQIHKNLKVISLPKNPILQLVYLRRILKEHIGPKTLIIGDNDVSLVLGWLASRFVSDIKVQISLHASLDHMLSPIGTFNIIRKHLFFWSLKRVQSIRLVSSVDVDRLTKLLPVSAPEVVVAPVPINIPLRKPDLSSKTKVAFIGRIHPERGLDDLLNILQLLSNDNKKYSFLIVGDGAKLDWLRSQIPKSELLHVEFLGHLEQAEIQKIWSEVKVLVSCAPTESYGLTLREALLNESWVVARSNATTISIESSFPNLLHTYETPQEAVKEIKELMRNHSVSESFEKFQQQAKVEQEEFLFRLAMSWVS